MHFEEEGGKKRFFSIFPIGVSGYSEKISPRNFFPFVFPPTRSTENCPITSNLHDQVGQRGGLGGPSGVGEGTGLVQAGPDNLPEEVA